MKTQSYSAFYILLLLPIFIIISCSQSKNEHPNAHFDKELKITPDSLSTEYMKYSLMRAGQMIYLDSILFITDYNQENLINVYDLKNKRLLTSFCRKGRGASDIAPPITMIHNKKSNTIDVYSKGKSAIIQYSLKEIIEKENINPPQVSFKAIKTPIVGSVVKAGNFFIGDGSYKDGRLMVANQSGKLLKTAIKYPDFAEDLDSMKRFLIYQSNLLVNKEQNRVVAASISTDNIVFLSFNDMELRKVKEFYDIKPEFQKVSDFAYKATDNNKMGFSDIGSSNKYVYALYSGRSRKEFGRRSRASDKLLVYDWNGQPKCVLNLGKEIVRFSVNPDGRSLIALSANSIDKIYTYSIKEDHF